MDEPSAGVAAQEVVLQEDVEAAEKDEGRFAGGGGAFAPGLEEPVLLCCGLGGHAGESGSEIEGETVKNAEVNRWRKEIAQVCLEIKG